MHITVNEIRCHPGMEEESFMAYVTLSPTSTILPLLLLIRVLNISQVFKF